MILNCVIVDDEPLAVELLASYARKIPFLNLVGTFHSAAASIKTIREKTVDLLFLDIQMPELSGMEYAKIINEPTKIVFTTAFSQYAVDGYRINAFDYLLKPYKQKELDDIIDRLLDAKSAPGVGTNSNDRQCAAPRKIAVQAVSELLLLTVEEILYTEYHKTARTWRLCLTNGSEYQLRKGTSADDILRLHPALVRVSSSCIVNLNYLSAVENTTQRCRLCAPFDNQEIYASRRYFSKLKEKFEML